MASNTFFSLGFSLRGWLLTSIPPPCTSIFHHTHHGKRHFSRRRRTCILTMILVPHSLGQWSIAFLHRFRAPGAVACTHTTHSTSQLCNPQTARWRIRNLDSARSLLLHRALLLQQTQLHSRCLRSPLWPPSIQQRHAHVPRLLFKQLPEKHGNHAHVQAAPPLCLCLQLPLCPLALNLESVCASARTSILQLDILLIFANAVTCAGGVAMAKH